MIIAKANSLSIPMEELNSRQRQLLKHIIDEYIETAEPVGSETIVSKYNPGVSPATVRNEMVVLTDKGYLKQMHTSAGRMPTPMALKFYIHDLMKERELPVKEEVEIKGDLYDQRENFHRLLRHTTRKLAQKTGVLSVVFTDDDEIYYDGAANILDAPEFYDIDLTKTVLTTVAEARILSALFARATGGEQVRILIGEELGTEYMDQCGIVFTSFHSGSGHTGMLGVIGPARMSYPRIIPTVRYFGNLLTELTASW
jgi:transcriptional regulator of heat shock response